VCWPSGSMLSLPRASKADVISGDFKARLDGSIVQVTVNSSATGKTFSGKIIAAGNTQSFTGSFEADASDTSNCQFHRYSL